MLGCTPLKGKPTLKLRGRTLQRWENPFPMTEQGLRMRALLVFFHATIEVAEMRAKQADPEYDSDADLIEDPDADPRKP